MNDIREVTEYTLSPNPVKGSGRAMLTLSSSKDFPATLEISTATGQKLSSQKVNIQSGISQHEILTDELTSGLYFVILHSDHGRLVERLLIID